MSNAGARGSNGSEFEFPRKQSVAQTPDHRTGGGGFLQILSAFSLSVLYLVITVFVYYVSSLIYHVSSFCVIFRKLTASRRADS